MTCQVALVLFRGRWGSSELRCSLKGEADLSVRDAGGATSWFRSSIRTREGRHGFAVVAPGAVRVPKGDGGAILLSRARRDNSRWQQIGRAHPPPTLAALNVRAQGARSVSVKSVAMPPWVGREPGGGAPFERHLRARSHVAR